MRYDGILVTTVLEPAKWRAQRLGTPFVPEDCTDGAADHLLNRHRSPFIRALERSL
jgi:hypothetical protein